MDCGKLSCDGQPTAIKLQRRGRHVGANKAAAEIVCLNRNVKICCYVVVVQTLLDMIFVVIVVITKICCYL